MPSRADVPESGSAHSRRSAIASGRTSGRPPRPRRPQRPSERRLPNTLNANFLGLVGADLLAAIPEIAASTGSACHEGETSISPVLAAMGLDPFVARGAVRLSVGRYTTEAIDRAAALCVIGRAR